MSRFDLEGVVFDVDGVLFDTERLSQETWNAVSTELNWPQVGRAYLEFVGQNRADILQKMLDLFGPDFPRETFLLTCSARSQARMEQEGVPLKPGVREILEFLTARGIPAALATSTNRERTHRRMEMTGLGPCFSAVVTGDQVEHSKPDPEIYQLACQALGTAPSRTLAIEDSRNGILSAHAAGMPVSSCAAAPAAKMYGPRFCARFAMVHPSPTALVWAIQIDKMRRAGYHYKIV